MCINSKRKHGLSIYNLSQLACSSTCDQVVTMHMVCKPRSYDLDMAPSSNATVTCCTCLPFLLVPSKVRELTVRKEAAGSLAFSLTWEPPASPNGIIRFYKVYTALWALGGTVGGKSCLLQRRENN